MTQTPPNPSEDGVTHINIYSKGNTVLGCRLSNFARLPFVHPKYGKFASIEGLWYWLTTRTSGDSSEFHRKREQLRTLHGFAAKKLGRELRGQDWDENENFRQNIILGLEEKSKHPYIKKLLVASNLPFKHYYVYGNGKVIEPTEGKWILEFWENKRLEYQRANESNS